MPDYQKTKVACYLGFVTQAISANFAQNKSTKSCVKKKNVDIKAMLPNEIS